MPLEHPHLLPSIYLPNRLGAFNPSPPKEKMEGGTTCTIRRPLPKHVKKTPNTLLQYYRKHSLAIRSRLHDFREAGDTDEDDDDDDDDENDVFLTEKEDKELYLLDKLETLDDMVMDAFADEFGQYRELSGDMGLGGVDSDGEVEGCKNLAEALWQLGSWEFEPLVTGMPGN